MKFENVIAGCIALVQREALKRGIEVEDLGTGHQFDNSFWKGLKDDSGIPTVKAKTDGYSIELRPFWSSPEIDIRRVVDGQEELLIFNFSDYEKQGEEYVHTKEFGVYEIRTDCHSNRYKKNINEIYKMIEFVESYQ